MCVYTPIFTEYSCTIEPVHNEHRCKEIMATISKWHPRLHTCIHILQIHNKHIQGYIEQTLYTWWSLNRSGQPLQHLMRSKISLFPHLIDYFPEFTNSSSAADRLLTMVLLNTDLFIQIRNSHAKDSLSFPTQTNDSHHFYSYQVVSNRTKSGWSQWCPTSLNQRNSFPHKGWEHPM